MTITLNNNNKKKKFNERINYNLLFNNKCKEGKKNVKIGIIIYEYAQSYCYAQREKFFFQ
jgi:hypothetical protein